MSCKNIMLFIVLLLMSEFALGDNSSGRVTRIYPNSSNTVYFRLEGNDSCKTNKYWFFNKDSENSDSWFSILLTAATTKSEVTVNYAGTCDPDNNQEINYLYQDF